MEFAVFPVMMLVWVMGIIWTFFVGILLPVTTYTALKRMSEDISEIRKHLTSPSERIEN